MPHCFFGTAIHTYPSFEDNIFIGLMQYGVVTNLPADQLALIQKNPEVSLDENLRIHIFSN